MPDSEHDRRKGGAYAHNTTGQDYPLPTTQPPTTDNLSPPPTLYSLTWITRAFRRLYKNIAGGLVTFPSPSASFPFSPSFSPLCALEAIRPRMYVQYEVEGKENALASASSALLFRRI